MAPTLANAVSVIGEMPKFTDPSKDVVASASAALTGIDPMTGMSVVDRLSKLRMIKKRNPIGN